MPRTSYRRRILPSDKTTLEPESDVPVQGLNFCPEDVFLSHIRKAEREQLMRAAQPSYGNPTHNAAHNYISIVHELFGTGTIGPTQPMRLDVPDYISVLRKPLDQCDIQYLEAKGGLCLPTTRFRNQLLRSYILWVHPQLPVLDLHRFLQAIADSDKSNRISLLLFHAVMLAAAAFVDISHIYEEGFISRKAAREALFQRAKALLELDCEYDRLSLVQAALLMVHWNDVPAEHQDAQGWIETCLSQSVAMCLHCNLQEKPTMTQGQLQVWRRTWWCLYQHACLKSPDLLVEMAILERAYATPVPMVTLNDFNLGVFSPECQATGAQCEVLQDTEYQKAQALIFIEKVRLCRVAQLSGLSSNIWGIAHGGHGPRVNGSPTAAIEALRRWSNNLPDAVCHHYPISLALSAWDQSIYVHRTWLRLLYLGLSYALHREVRQGLGGTFTGISLQNEDTECLEQILFRLSETFQEIYSLNLSDNLPSASVALLTLVLAFHRRAIDTGTRTTQTEHAVRFHQCWMTMSEMVDRSEIAKLMVGKLRDSLSGIWEHLSSALLPL